MPRSSTSPAVVLLVQPDADTLEMYAVFLRHHGLLPVPVANTMDALNAAPHADVIVTEMLLRGHIDGLELLTRLRGDERTREIPLIVLTVCAWTTERARAEEAGCDVFLAKPCLPDELLNAVRRVLPVRFDA